MPTHPCEPETNLSTNITTAPLINLHCLCVSVWLCVCWGGVRILPQHSETLAGITKIVYIILNSCNKAEETLSIPIDMITEYGVNYNVLEIYFMVQRMHIFFWNKSWDTDHIPRRIKVVAEMSLRWTRSLVYIGILHCYTKHMKHFVALRMRSYFWKQLLKQNSSCLSGSRPLRLIDVLCFVWFSSAEIKASSNLRHQTPGPRPLQRTCAETKSGEINLHHIKTNLNASRCYTLSNETFMKDL